MRVGASKDRNMEHPGDIDIAHMENLPGRFLRRILSVNRMPHDRKLCHVFFLSLSRYM
jgi:hypothetical protein